MTDIFVSYASSERERLRPLVEALEAQGWTVWWDKRFLSGNRIGKIIAAKLDESRCVIVAWTKLSANSDWVEGEADHAKEAGKLLPIRLDGKSDVPINFRGLYTEDFSNWTGDRSAPEFIQLCDAIRDKLGSPPPSSSGYSTPMSNPIWPSAQRWRWKIPAIALVMVCIGLVAAAFLLYIEPRRTLTNAEPQRTFANAVQAALCVPNASGVTDEATIAAVRDFLRARDREIPATIDLTSPGLRLTLQTAIDDVGSCATEGFKTAFEVGRFGVPRTQRDARIKSFQRGLAEALESKNSTAIVTQTGKFDDQTRAGIRELRRMTGTRESDEVDAQLLMRVLSSL